MIFLDPTLDSFNTHISKLSADTQPEWGTMSAQEMVEHLCDWVDLILGSAGKLQLEIPEDKVARAQAFLSSEHPLPRGFKANFFPEKNDLNYENLDAAIQAFRAKWDIFESHYNEQPEYTTLHPSFGELNYNQVLQLHSKHLTHHFEQFNLI